MKAWMRIGATAFLLSTVVACGLVLTGCATRGIRVHVVNNAPGPVHDMKISYTGGSVAIEQLKTGGSYRKTIEVTTTTDVDVAFSLANGEKKTQLIRAQLEPGYVGELRLEITPEGGVGWERHLTVKPARSPKGAKVEERP